jgi:hypothetical protein
VFDNAQYQVNWRSPYEIEIMDDVAVARYDYDIRVRLQEGVESIEQEGALNRESNDMKYHDVLLKKPDGESNRGKNHDRASQRF